MPSNKCDVFLLNKNSNNKKFPIVDYSNVFYDENHSSLQDTIDKFITYCTRTAGIDSFTDISTVNFNNFSFAVQKNYSSSNEYNYCLIHDLHDSKWYCCFINNVTWNSNLTVATFNFEIDIFHTYIKTVTFKKCFIERQHVTDDRYGVHVLDEGIGVSNYVMKNSAQVANTDFTPVLAIADTSLLRLGTTRQGDLVPEIVNVNHYEKTICLVAPNYDTVIDPQIGVNGMGAFTNFISHMYDMNKGQSIVACFYIPTSFIATHFQVCSFDPNLPDSGTDEPREPLYCTKNFTSAIPRYNITLSLPNNDTISYDGSRTLKLNNRKSLTYPFYFCEVTNNTGGKIQLKHELSNYNNHNVILQYALSPCHNGQPYAYAITYDGLTENYNYSITGLSNPDLPYIHNSYGAFISSQRNSLANSYEYINKDKEIALLNNNIDVTQEGVGQMAGFLGGFLSENVPAALSSLFDFAQGHVNDIQKQKTIEYNAIKAADAVSSKIRDAKTMGNTATSVGAYNSILNTGAHGFTYYHVQASFEEMLTIDNYFSKFGYKINDYQVPNLNTRPIFNYVKCSEVNLIANMPSDYISVMKAIFAAGVTLWHDLDNMYDYDFDHNLAGTR